MNIKIENWNGYEIRFVEKEPNDWWAVAADICKALGLKQVSRAIKSLPIRWVTVSKVPHPQSESKELEVNIINEKGIYRLVFKSQKQEAEAFQDWVFDVIKTLREASGLEAFQIFRMLDKEHQKEAMRRLHDSLKLAERVDYIKANVIANKAVSTNYGLSKMIKKGNMSPPMLIERQQILDDTVDLMAVQQKFNLDVSVSQTIYKKHNKSVAN